MIRKRIEHAVDAADLPADQKRLLLHRQPVVEHLIYKGMLTADQMGADVPRI